MHTMPSLYLPHGAPDLTLTDHVAKRFMQDLTEVLKSASGATPKGIVVVSAHWQTTVPTITTGSDPETIYDFYGFPKQLYSIVYPAKTSPWLIESIRQVFERSDFPLMEDPDRGFDHGAWTPLRLMWPQADVPVLQLSLGMGKDAHYHVQLGRTLAPLREKGILVLGSGSLTHNLAALGPEGASPPGWAVRFDQWVSEKLLAGDIAAVLEFYEKAPDVRTAHPTDEHLMPLFVALGSGLDGGGIRKIHHSFSYQSISMASFAFGSGHVVDKMNL